MFKECFYRSQECKRIAYSKVVPIGGDIGQEGLGFDEETKAILASEVQVILSCAANTMFTEPLTSILKSNYRGPMELLKMAKTWSRCQVFTHVSTTACGTHLPHNSVVPEEIYWPGDPDEIVDDIMGRDPAYVAANEKKFLEPWDNPYVYSKSLVERGIKKHHGDLKAIIVRPPITSACYKEPMIGWLDGLHAVAITAFPMVMGIKRNFFVGHGKHWVSPGDIVSNGIICAAAYCDAVPNEETRVVQTCVSHVSDVKWTEFGEAGSPYLAYNPTHVGVLEPGANMYETTTALEIAEFLDQGLKLKVMRALASLPVVGSPDILK